MAFEKVKYRYNRLKAYRRTGKDKTAKFRQTHSSGYWALRNLRSKDGYTEVSHMKIVSPKRKKIVIGRESSYSSKHKAL